MTEKLTPEQRRRVAEACYPGLKWFITEHGSVRSDVHGGPFWPEHSTADWKCMVRWLAPRLGEWADFLDAIATDNTEALEHMVHEILEAQDV